MASYGDELLLDSSSPWSGVSSLSSFSIPMSFIFQEAKESIDEEDPRPTSSNGAYITVKSAGCAGLDCGVRGLALKHQLSLTETQLI